MSQEGVTLLFVGAVSEELLELLQAIAFDDLESVRSKLTTGIDINASTSNNFNPLLVAAYERQWEIVQYLISLGADVNVQDSWQGSTPLHKAICWKAWETAIELLKSGVDVLRTNHDGNTPLMCLQTIAKADIKATCFYHPTMSEFGWVTREEIPKLSQEVQTFIRSTEFIVEAWDFQRFVVHYDEYAEKRGGWPFIPDSEEDLAEVDKDLKHSYLFMACVGKVSDYLDTKPLADPVYTLAEFARHEFDHEQVYADDIDPKFRKSNEEIERIRIRFFCFLLSANEH